MRGLGACLLAVFGGVMAAPARAEVDYQRDVQPILRKHCYSCHGQLRQKSGLRLDHASFIRAGGDNGPAIGSRGEESLLIRALLGTVDVEQMPLEAKPLAEQEIAILKAWIDEGAKAPDEKLPDDPRKHWAFQPPARPPLPAVGRAAWSTHPVDRFLAAEHEARSLVPTPEAPRHVLLRRAYVDLLGYPPTVDELRAFLADSSADAYERVVDKLLASPQYGERWGRHWMDVWRYSDWDGFGKEVRESQPNIWRWRDWIIESLNADKPYDQMIREMLAADELEPDDPSSLRASGFLARNWYRFNRNVWLDATVEHTSKAFLGITLNCARCHDHMYDPILQTEYYAFRAFFEPHEVRTDKILAWHDAAGGELVRAYDATAEAPTYLFARGEEAKPDKEHPLAPAVPQVLGGDELRIARVELAPTTYYPGLQPAMQQQVIAEAQTALERAEAEVARSNTALVEARKKHAEVVAAAAPATEQPAVAGTPAAAEKPVEGTKPEPADTTATVAASEANAALAAEEMLSAAAKLTAVRAKVAADLAAFANPPASNAADLAREAGRAERVAAAQQARTNVSRLRRDLSRIAGGTDDAAKKKLADLENKLTAARKAEEAAQTALGTPGETYTRFTGVYPATSTGRRAALAGWIASKRNPLTARVAINHVWMRHFGSPIVPTVFDFGLNGKRPTHPALLDWLAVELMDQGWRMKPIHRLLVTSTAYRMQSSAGESTSAARDPENVYLWRMNPRRMEAEAVRDSTLRVAGGLDFMMFGPDLDPADGATVPRRSLYFRSSKEKKVTFLAMFDSANVTDCYRRSETVVPQQALAMVNSSLTLAATRRLAAALAGPANGGPAGDNAVVFVAAAFERVLCRPPSDAERIACLEFLADQARRFTDPSALAAFTTGPENPVRPAADPHARARENLVHVLLNHNDFLTVR